MRSVFSLSKKIQVVLSSEDFNLKELNKKLGIRSTQKPLEILCHSIESYMHLSKFSIRKSPILVNLLMVNNKHMKAINQSQRGKSKTTDVLSFPLWDSLRQLKKTKEMKELNEFIKINSQIPIGDIVISLEVLLKQANDFGITPMEEFYQLFFHGLLHLLGYDHERSLKEAKLMENEERTLFFMLKKHIKVRAPK